MMFSRSNVWRRLRDLWVSPGLGPAQQAGQIQAIERDVITPVKVMLIVTLIYYFYASSWVAQPQVSSIREVAFETIRSLFLGYVGVHIVAAAVFIGVRRLPLPVLQWMVFTLGLLDGVLLAALTLVTGGFDSILFWLFLGLILHHATTIPLATPQIVLNIVTCLCYLVAGLIDVQISQREVLELSWDARQVLDLGNPVNPAEPFLLRIVLLFLWTLCCYGVQALVQKQRLVEEEAQEFAERQEQLQAAGRLAAEIAHQIKNPLSIITNAAYSLQRAVQDGKKSVDQQIGIIREEVDRADRIITELMGYAQLAEGKVERLDIVQEFERAIAQVFPVGASYQVKVTRDFRSALPTLLMQRGHLSEILVNLLTNARQAMKGRGALEVSAHYGENYSVVAEITDHGPGIAGEKLERIFEAYFTTKDKGTGLGLAIVKHNVEIYGGHVSVQSELGKGTKFILTFPAKPVMKLNS